jgi:osmotically-inducible protein OsmY
MTRGLPRFRGTALVAALCAALVLPALPGCVGVAVVAGVGATAMVATDRRTTGAQMDDESIELKIATAASSSYGANEVHLNVTSYNATVLLTGEIPNDTVRRDLVKVARGTERVKAVEDYMVIGPPSDLAARSNDSYITSKVKARFLESDKFSGKDIKVVTERSTVYLMGVVRRDEGAAAAQVAATTAGVARVVKVFEYTN